MTPERNLDDEEAIWRAWGALEADSGAAVPEAGFLDEERQTLVRLYTETAGLYARGLQPAELPGGLRERVMAGARQASLPGQSVATPMTAAPAAAGDEVFDLGQTPIGQVPFPRVRPSPVERLSSTGEFRPRRPSRWPLAIAATLALGFAGVAAYLWQQFEEQKAGVARYENRIRVLEEQAREVSALESELARTRTNLSLVTSRGVSACALRPVGAARAGSHGMLYVAADHQHWVFAVEGLAPSPDLHEYQLWFLVGERPVSGGTFRVEAGGRVELSSPTMPAGTTAVAITLEPRGGMPLPTGPRVLYGDRLIEVL